MPEGTGMAQRQLAAVEDAATEEVEVDDETRDSRLLAAEEHATNMIHSPLHERLPFNALLAQQQPVEIRAVARGAIRTMNLRGCQAEKSQERTLQGERKV
eukprot:129515-Hanusia_phi.AAC.2